MGNGMSWTKREAKKLPQVYAQWKAGELSDKQLQKLFKGRSTASITGKMFRMVENEKANGNGHAEPKVEAGGVIESKMATYKYGHPLFRPEPPTYQPRELVMVEGNRLVRYLEQV